MTLGDLAMNATAVVDEILGGGAVSQRLLAMGFLPGSALRIVQVAPFGDPITVELDGWRVSLRRAEASLVGVREARP